MSKRFLVVLLIISVVINLAAVFTFGYYWWEERGSRRSFASRWPGRGPGWRGSHLIDKLSLTEEQIEVIDRRHEEMRSEMALLMTELFKKRKELMMLLREAEPDKARAGTLLRKIASLQTKVDSHVFESLCEMKDILTPLQKEQFLILLEERHSYPRGMHHPSWEELPGRMMKSPDRKRGDGEN